jgi:hypothetical protein
MSRLYVGPPSGCELEPLAGFLLWPGKKVSLPATNPYTQALIAEGWLLEDIPAIFVISSIQEALATAPRSFLVFGLAQAQGFGSIPSHFVVTI